MEQLERTALGYRRNSAARSVSGGSMDTPFNFLEYPTDIVLQSGGVAV